MTGGQEFLGVEIIAFYWHIFLRICPWISPKFAKLNVAKSIDRFFAFDLQLKGRYYYFVFVFTVEKFRVPIIHPLSTTIQLDRYLTLAILLLNKSKSNGTCIFYVYKEKVKGEVKWMGEWMIACVYLSYFRAHAHARFSCRIFDAQKFDCVVTMNFTKILCFDFKHSNCYSVRPKKVQNNVVITLKTTSRNLWNSWNLRIVCFFCVPTLD